MWMEPFYRVTVSALLYPTPRALMSPNGHRCRMWGGSSSVFWLFSKTALISLPEAGAPRFPVSLGPMRDVSCPRSEARMSLFFQGIPPLKNRRRGSDKKRVRGETGSRGKREGESVLVKVPFHSTRLSVLPRQQLVNCTRLTRLWYKLINDMHLARKGNTEKGEHMITSIKREAEDCLMSWNIQQLLCCTEIEESEEDKGRENTWNVNKAYVVFSER